jgi:hypothetical protein
MAMNNTHHLLFSVKNLISLYVFKLIFLISIKKIIIPIAFTLMLNISDEDRDIILKRF